MPFFDFHCHPGLKPQFSNPADAPSPWQNINATLEVSILKQIGINLLFNEILNSQSSLDQLSENVKLIGLVLHAPEQNMGVSLAERKIIQGSKVNLINYDRVKYIAEGTHGFALIQQELERLQNAQSTDTVRLIIINNRTDFDEQKAQTVFAFLIVEGLHCFFNDPKSPIAKQEFDENFEKFTASHKVVAMNLCHLQQNPFCNHAHGIQFFRNELFYPTGSGLTIWGREMVEKLRSKKILIDVKHMSLRSRWQLYQMLKDGETDTHTQPIVCTHAGVTGLSVNERVKYLFQRPIDRGVVYEVSYLKPRSKLLQDTYFNCSSINLYDEDIEAILLSGGMIGLSFDQRIIGFANENLLRNATIPHEVEFISTHEATFFLGPFPLTLPVYNKGDVWSSEDFQNLDPSLNEILHFKFFFNQVFHILNVAKTKGIPVTQAARQICLGSDFDGLINAIDNCKTALQLPSFKQQAVTRLPALLKEANLHMEQLVVQEFIEDLFYRNGRDFILKRLDPLAL